MSEERFNPAQRLYNILRETQGIGPGVRVQDVWIKVLGLKQGDTIALFGALPELHHLVDEVERRIHEQPDLDAESYLVHFPAIRGAIQSPKLTDQWGAGHQGIVNAAIESVRFSAERLGRVIAEKRVPEDTLTTLRQDVDALADAVRKAEVDPELRAVLLSCLETFRRAIAEYHIRGAGGLREAAAQTVGDLLFLSKKIKEEEKKEKRKRKRKKEEQAKPLSPWLNAAPYVRRLVRIARNVYKVAAVASGIADMVDLVAMLPEGIRSALPPGVDVSLPPVVDEPPPPMADDDGGHV